MSGARIRQLHSCWTRDYTLFLNGSLSMVHNMIYPIEGEGSSDKARKDATGKTGSQI